MGMKLRYKTWEVLGPLEADLGSYARLYNVQAADGQEAVAKCVRKDPSAQRELLFGDSIRAAEFPNVIPVIDSGEHENFYVIVMPRATMSLNQYLRRNPAGIPLQEALAILDDVAAALEEINGAIIHRDLKPANILQHDGVWKLADFGVSRYTEAATATETRKEIFTFEYAAPEQWRYESTSSRTDVYSFGVIAYELIEGHRPFTGPRFREQHLLTAPPTMTSGTAKIRQLITECLLKDPNTRPEPDRLRERLRTAEVDATKYGTVKLIDLSARRTQQVSAEQARLAAERDKKERLQAIVEDARTLLKPVAQLIRKELNESAPEVLFDIVIGNAAPLYRAKYGNALLEFDRIDPVESAELPFRVYAYASITVQTGNSVDAWRGRSHSLWFCDALHPGRAAWYELAFTSADRDATRSRLDPFSRPPWSIEQAFLNVVGSPELAWPVTELDLADPSEFIQRWIGWFADAADGSLTRSSAVPDSP
jgi:hypothetical protein